MRMGIIGQIWTKILLPIPYLLICIFSTTYKVLIYYYEKILKDEMIL